jgi:DNA-binding transcriptional LysR family regulator
MPQFPVQLRIFHEVVRAGSVRATSDQLGLSASSITRQIQLLEHQMGAALLNRSSVGVVPTHAGKLVADFAQSVVLEYDRLRADIDEQRSTKGHVRIAAVESTMQKVLAAISSLRAKFSEVTFAVTMLPAIGVVDSVKAGEVDVGITFCAPPDPDLSVIARYLEPVVIAVSPLHEWAERKTVSLQDLSLIPLGAPERTFGVRRLVDQCARDVGLQIHPTFVTNSFEALRCYARDGNVSLLPRMSIEKECQFGVLRMIPIDVPALQEATADAVVLCQKKPTRLLRLFFSEMERASEIRL